MYGTVVFSWRDSVMVTDNIGYSKILRLSPQSTNENAHGKFRIRNMVDCESHFVKPNIYLSSCVKVSV